MTNLFYMTAWPPILAHSSGRTMERINTGTVTPGHIRSEQFAQCLPLESVRVILPLQAWQTVGTALYMSSALNLLIEEKFCRKMIVNVII